MSSTNVSSQHPNAFPKLHNAAWPGVVGKGGPEDPFIDLDTMLDLTAAADVDGRKFDGVDLFLFDPHVSIDASDAELEDLAERVKSRGLVIGSIVAPVWPPTGGGSAAGGPEQVEAFLTQVRKGCQIGSKLRQLGVRPYGVVRIDSATSVNEWIADPDGNQSRIADTFKAACDIAEEFDERLAAEGEICWGGMHSWKNMVDLLEQTGMPGTVGFQADLAHTYLYLLGYNAPEHALLKEGYSEAEFEAAYIKMTNALRPWTIDFHVAQNDGSVHGSGAHDKTGRHCQADDPNGKLDITKASGYWLKDAASRGIQHICWDGCMFPNAVLETPDTWNKILKAMIDVRNAHGWS